MKRIVLYCAYMIVLISCGGKNHQINDLISFEEFTEKSFSDLPHEVLMGIKFIPINSDSLKYIFSSPSKILMKNDKVYINDFRSRKLFVYALDGSPRFLLSKFGRTNGEYLQITDFDVDGNGNIWIIDGQSDKVIGFTSNGIHISSTDLPFQADYIKCLNNGQFMFSIAEWETGRYRNSHLIITDSNINEVMRCVKKEEERDANYKLVPSAGIHSVEGKVFFHKPISDLVYSINIDDFSEHKCKFDFAGKTVPMNARIDTERYINEFPQYNTLAGSVYFDKDLIVGGIMTDNQIMSFIIDRQNNVRFVQDDQYMSMVFFGISDGYLVYMFRPGSEIYPPNIPDKIKSHIMSNNGYTLALLPLDLISTHLN